MSLNIKPISDRVVIAPLAAETTTASGIIIPDNAKEKPQEAEVIAVGEEVKEIKLDSDHKGHKMMMFSDDNDFVFPGMSQAPHAAHMLKMHKSSNSGNSNIDRPLS